VRARALTALSPKHARAVLPQAKGIFLGCKTILPYFLQRNYGRIVNIASVAGKEGNAGMVAYSASKGACAVRARRGRGAGCLAHTTTQSARRPFRPPQAR